MAQIGSNLWKKNALIIISPQNIALFLVFLATKYQKS